MGTVSIRKPRKDLVIVACLLALVVGLIAGPASAEASTSPYCGAVMPPTGSCYGAARWLYQAYGWGDQGGVCVATGRGWTWYCVGGANTGVYSANAGSNVWAEPFILNNSNVTNYVHGVALTQ